MFEIVICDIGNKQCKRAEFLWCGRGMFLMGRLTVGVRSFLLLFGGFSEIGYLTTFHINLFSDLINIRSCFCFCVCIYVGSPVV